jgi:hypothetical protein
MPLSAFDICLREIDAMKAFHATKGVALGDLGADLRRQQLAGTTTEAEAAVQYLAGQVEMYRDMTRVAIRAARKAQAEHGRVSPAYWVDIRYYRRCYLSKVEAMRVRLGKLPAPAIQQAAA